MINKKDRRIRIVYLVLSFNLLYSLNKHCWKGSFHLHVSGFNSKQHFFSKTILHFWCNLCSGNPHGAPPQVGKQHLKLLIPQNHHDNHHHHHHQYHQYHHHHHHSIGEGHLQLLVHPRIVTCKKIN